MKSTAKRGFTLLEIMIIVAIIGIVLAIAMPTWLRQREISRASACQENLSKIHGSVEMYAMEHKIGHGSPIDYPDDIVKPNGVEAGEGYLKKVPECPSGGIYSVATVGETPTCSIGAENSPFAPHEFQL